MCSTCADDAIVFVDALADAPARTSALAAVARQLAAEGALTPWRDERYAVAPSFDAPPLFELERAAARYFGIHTYAAHVNGLVRTNERHRACGSRGAAPTKAIDPGMLDNLVGGGIAAGMSVAQTRRQGSVGRSRHRGRRSPCAATAAGELTLMRESADGFQRETIFVYDLSLRADFVPANQDGEAVEHRLRRRCDADRRRQLDADHARRRSR